MQQLRNSWLVECVQEVNELAGSVIVDTQKCLAGAQEML